MQQIHCQPVTFTNSNQTVIQTKNHKGLLLGKGVGQEDPNKIADPKLRKQKNPSLLFHRPLQLSPHQFQLKLQFKPKDLEHP
jgi:hypothetical protein